MMRHGTVGNIQFQRYLKKPERTSSIDHGVNQINSYGAGRKQQQPVSKKQFKEGNNPQQPILSEQPCHSPGGTQLPDIGK